MKTALFARVGHPTVEVIYCGYPSFYKILEILYKEAMKYDDITCKLVTQATSVCRSYVETIWKWVTCMETQNSI